MSKADYVRNATQTRDHTCHWPGCERQVKPAMWGCFPHWKALPKNLQDRIWRTYRPGQEIDGNVSQGYFEAAKEVQEWIKKQAEPKKEFRIRKVAFMSLAKGGSKQVSELVDYPGIVMVNTQETRNAAWIRKFFFKDVEFSSVEDVIAEFEKANLKSSEESGNSEKV